MKVKLMVYCCCVALLLVEDCDARKHGWWWSGKHSHSHHHDRSRSSSSSHRSYEKPPPHNSNECKGDNCSDNENETNEVGGGASRNSEADESTQNTDEPDTVSNFFLYLFLFCSANNVDFK